MIREIRTCSPPPGRDVADDAPRHTERDAATEALFAQLAASDVDSDDGRRAVESICRLHLSLCEGLARRYAHRGIERDDLRQVARLALLKAIHRYRPSAGASFIAFAVPTILGELKRQFRDQGWMVRPSRRVQELHLSLRHVRESMTHELGEAPTRDQLTQVLDVTPSQLAEADSAGDAFRPLSLDALDAGRPQALGDTLGAPGAQVEDVCAHIDLARALGDLTPDSRRLLHLRFVEDLSQREIARELRTSQMQVSRLLARVFAQLRQSLTCGGGHIGLAK